MMQGTIAMGQQRPRPISGRDPRLDLRPVLSSSAPALLAGAAANGFVRHPELVAADSVTKQWRLLAIASVAQGNATGARAVALDRVRLFDLKPPPRQPIPAPTLAAVVDSTPLGMDSAVLRMAAPARSDPLDRDAKRSAVRQLMLLKERV